MHEFHAPAGALDNRGAAVDPVTAVDVGDAIELAQCGSVDVAADHAVDAALARVMYDRVLEIENETHGALDLALRIAGERPVAGHAQEPAQGRQPQIEVHEDVVGPVPQECEPAVVARHLVEFVAVDEQVAPPVGAGMDVIALDPDVAEGGADVLARRLVVVAGNEHDVHVLAREAQDLLHERVLRGRPVHAALSHRPEVDNVAEQKQVLGLVRQEEFEQAIGLTSARPEVDVRQKDRAHALRRRPAQGRRRVYRIRSQ